MDTKLIRNINKKNHKRAKEKDFGDTEVYKVIGDSETLYYWNSSNSSSPKHDFTLNEIMDLILEDTYEGTVNDGWNEIMFEVELN